MLLWINEYLQQFYNTSAIFQSIILRSIFAFFTSLIICLFIAPVIINFFKNANIRQIVRDDGPKTHLIKVGTPTMGGILILGSLTITNLLWSKLDNVYICIALATTLVFGIIGYIDDYRKLILNHSRGLSIHYKLFLQSLSCLLLGIFLYYHSSEMIFVPYFKNFTISLGILYIPFAFIVVIGTSNAVNLTDGLDGLAILPISLIAGALGILAYITGNIKFAEYLVVPYIPKIGEITVFCASIVGSSLGFLWYNAYPAKIFMGDVGALGLGAALGIVALLIKQELILFIMGGLFVVEALSVILQVVSYKLCGKRIFKMAPIHHHYELIGYPESLVIIRCWILTIILVFLGLISIKIK